MPFSLSAFVYLCVSMFVFVCLCLSLFILVHPSSFKIVQILLKSFDMLLIDGTQSMTYNFNYSVRILQYFIGTLYKK